MIELWSIWYASASIRHTDRGRSKRTIQKEVETVLARQLLEGKVRDGQTVHVDFDPQREVLTFT